MSVQHPVTVFLKCISVVFIKFLGGIRVFLVSHKPKVIKGHLQVKLIHDFYLPCGQIFKWANFQETIQDLFGSLQVIFGNFKS